MTDVIILILTLCGAPQGLIVQDLNTDSAVLYSWTEESREYIKSTYPEDRYFLKGAGIPLDKVTQGQCL